MACSSNGFRENYHFVVPNQIIYDFLNCLHTLRIALLLHWWLWLLLEVPVHSTNGLWWLLSWVWLLWNLLRGLLGDLRWWFEACLVVSIGIGCQHLMIDGLFWGWWFQHGLVQLLWNLIMNLWIWRFHSAFICCNWVWGARKAGLTIGWGLVPVTVSSARGLVLVWFCMRLLFFIACLLGHWHHTVGSHGLIPPHHLPRRLVLGYRRIGVLRL